jgi:hypothetical protein
VKELNNLVAKMNFTLEEEESNKLSFLDIAIKTGTTYASRYAGNPRPQTQ